MTVRRVMGLETEYGISVPGEPMANPMYLSGLVISTYAAAHGIRVGQHRWDYAFEDPLADARGWVMRREEADSSQLTDDPSMANVVLDNGARYYVDHAHPEYSSPEVTTPRDALRWDRAGDLVALESVWRLGGTPGQSPVNLYKNNTDGKGASYGTHENYLMSRRTEFPRIVRDLTPFFVSRQVVCGAGRVGIGQDSRRAGFQIAQRSDFFECEVGLETTLKRPIINTRDEPHADAERWRRLHVIIGDANLCDVATVLKTGTTSLVLGMIEDGWLREDWSVREPVDALHRISHDPGLTETVTLHDGRAVTGLDLQWMSLEAARAWLDARGDDPVPEATAEVMALWEEALAGLGRDVFSMTGALDWVTKLQLLESYRARDRMEWDDDRLRLIDIQYSDIRPEKGIAHRLRDRGRIRTLVNHEEVKEAVRRPPEDTRAWFRGTCLSRFRDEVAAASWDSVVFDLGSDVPLKRVPMLDPLKGTRAALGDLVAGAREARQLLDALSG